MSSTFKLALVPALYAVLLLCACSAKPVIDDPLPEKPAVDASNFAEKFADAACTMLARCSPGIFGTDAQCRRLMEGGSNSSGTDFGGMTAVAASIGAGKIRLDGKKAEACFHAIATIACDALPASDSIDAIPGCEGVLTGLVATGAPCVADEACVAGDFCLRAGNAQNMCQATCQKKGDKCRADEDCAADKICENDACVAPANPAGAEGESCGDHQRCQAGLHCEMVPGGHEGPVSKCVLTVDEGGVCYTDDSCKTGLHCQFGESDAEGHCAKPAGPAGAGQPCQVDGMNSCQTGLICAPTADLSASVCVAPKNKGEACTSLFECGGMFGPLICDQTQKVCVDKPTSGACPAPLPFACAPDKAYCDLSASTPTCKLFKQAGEQCQNDGECGGSGDMSCDGTSGTCKKITVTTCQP